jgi:CRISPR-associated endoribonuclease Cas6
VPSRWEVALVGPAEVPVPLAAPLAVVSGWLDDPLAGGLSPGRRSGHADQGRKWTCGPLRTAGPVPGAGVVTMLQVRLLDDSLGDRLAAATRPGRAVRMGAGTYRITQPAQRLDLASWLELRQWSGARAWQLRFVTPACVRRHNQTSPLLAPESVARGLAERWHRLDPATAPSLPGPGAGPVWVSDIEGHSEVQILARHSGRAVRPRAGEEIISGFTGRVRYVCDRGSDAEAAAFDALVAFACFAGVGSHTTLGFGVTVPEPTWQPPTVRAGRA